MKNTIKHISSIFAAILCMASSFVANAAPLPPVEDDGVRLFKSLSEPDADGLYTITLDAFVTGSSTTIKEMKPCDIVLVLDLSSSMENNNVNVEKKTKVNPNTTLSISNNYKVVISNEEYYLKMFYSNKKYYLRIKKEQSPTSLNDGLPLPGTADEKSAYKVKNTDEIYTIGTESVTRLEALKRATKQFVQTVYDNSPEEGVHKISFVGFNWSGGLIAGCTNSAPFRDVTEANLNSILTSVDNISIESLGINEVPSSYKSWSSRNTYSVSYFTNPAEGFYKAAEVLESVKNEAKPKVVVFFTDGEPCAAGTDDFNNKYARAAVNMSYVIKQPTNASISVSYENPELQNPTTHSFKTGYGAKVYSVAILKTEGNQTRRFLHYASSNYTDKKLEDSYTFPNNTSGEGGEAPHDYYQLSNGSNLSDIFKKIAEESSKGGASTKLEATTTQVVDVMSANFNLPSGVTVNDIDVHVESFIGASLQDAENSSKMQDRTSETYTNNWAKEGQTGYNYVPESDGGSPAHIGPYVTIGKVDGKDQVVVHNFYFSKDDAKDGNGLIIYNTDGTVKTPGNWVGSRDLKSGVKKCYGNKLVIQFKVKLNPDYEPGYGVPSNDPTSGIKILKDGEWTQQWAFEVPSIDVPGLCILKDGLNVGESSLFNVSNSDASKNYHVALTQKKAAGSSGSKLACYAILKVGKGTFTVTENTNWSWTYTPDSSTSTVQEQEIMELTKEQVSNIKKKIMDEGNILYSNENVALGKTSVIDGIKYCMLGEPEELSEQNSVVVIFYFKNAKTVASPGNAESYAHNVFKGGTRKDAPDVEIGGEEIDEM